MKNIIEVNPAETQKFNGEKVRRVTSNYAAATIGGKTKVFPLPVTYAQLLSILIGMGGYDADSTLAILANYEDAKDETSDLSEQKRKEYVKEYEDYQAWRKEAKAIAKEAIV